MNKDTASLIAAAILEDEDLAAGRVAPLVAHLAGAVSVGRIHLADLLNLEDEFMSLARQGHAMWCVRWETEDGADPPRLYTADFRAIARALNEQLAPQILEGVSKPKPWSKK